MKAININPINEISNTSTSSGETQKSNSFLKSLESLSGVLNNSENEISNLLNNKGKTSEAFTNLAEAEIYLSSLVTIRDKWVNAYNEIIKMPM